jgi:NTP pyrophosphatase (non-canonical NTP hydrolase)
MSMFTSAMFLEAMENTCRNIHEWALSKGFWDEKERLFSIDGCQGEQEVKIKTRPWNFGEKIALVHSELSEALEKHRKHLGKGEKDAPDEHCPEHGGVEIELADTVIRIMDLCGKMKIDLGRAIMSKMAYNQNREHKHGKGY